MKYTPKLFLVVLLFHHAVKSEDSKKQVFETLKGQAPSTRQYYSPLASLTVGSILECAMGCVQHPCCMSLFVNQTNSQHHCSLYDVVFNDTFLIEDDSYRYMYKTPFKGKLHKVLIIQFGRFQINKSSLDIKNWRKTRKSRKTSSSNFRMRPKKRQTLI